MVINILMSLGRATKCYVLTRDGKVRFRELGHKIDPETGLQCRDYTPAMLERLKEYQAGKRPEQVFENPIFFEVRTGEPIIWYWASRSGEILIFNFMGFNPKNGEELNPITKEIVEAYEIQEEKRKEEQERLSRPPKLVDPNTYPFFNSTTGKPQVWYWRGPNGEYEFYDNQGFHKATGDELKLINKDVIAAWRQYVVDKQKEQQRREQELRDRQEQERQKQLQLQKAQERERQLAEERRQREEEERIERQRRDEQAQADRQQRQAQSGAMCDQAAANPNDRQKPSNVTGVDYNDINSSEALEVCQTAMNSFPGEPRYKYQYARVLESSNPNLAIKLHSELTRQQRYIASFDNLGSLLLKRKDYSGAIAAFKNGAQANDPDSLVSLADLIQRGIVRVPDPESYRLALLARAAKLGHQGAQREIEEQTKIIQQNQLQQQYQSQQEQLMLNLFGNILGGVLRH